MKNVLNIMIGLLLAICGLVHAATPIIIEVDVYVADAGDGYNGLLEYPVAQLAERTIARVLGDEEPGDGKGGDYILKSGVWEQYDYDGVNTSLYPEVAAVSAGSNLVLTASEVNGGNKQINPLNLPVSYAAQKYIEESARPKMVSSLMATDAFVLLLGGQSNADGATNSGIIPVTGMLPNVKFVRSGGNTFESHVSGNTNAYHTTYAGNYSIALAIATRWQGRINDGEDLPDLYIANISASSSGFGSDNPNQSNTRYLWRLDKTTPTGGAVTNSLVDRFDSAVSDAIAALVSSGKRVVIGGEIWFQGEADSTSQPAADDMARQLGLLFNHKDGVTNINTPVVWARLRSNSPNYPAIQTVNDAMMSTFSQRPSLALDAFDAPHYNESDDAQTGNFNAANFGVFEDGVHYNEHTIDYFADTIMDYFFQGNFGFDHFSQPVVADVINADEVVIAPSGTGVNVEINGNLVSKVDTSVDAFEKFLLNDNAEADFSFSVTTKQDESVILSASLSSSTGYLDSNFAIYRVVASGGDNQIKYTTQLGLSNNNLAAQNLTGNHVLTISRMDGVIRFSHRPEGSLIETVLPSPANSSESGIIYLSLYLFQGTATAELSDLVKSGALATDIELFTPNGVTRIYSDDGVSLKFEDASGLISNITLE